MDIINREFDRVVSALQGTSATERRDIAESIGVSASILIKIKSGEVTNPRKETLAALHNYFFKVGDDSIPEPRRQVSLLEMDNANNPEKAA